MSRGKRSTGVRIAEARRLVSNGSSPEEVMATLKISRPTLYRYMSLRYDHFLDWLPPILPAPTSLDAPAPSNLPSCVQNRDPSTSRFQPGCAPGTGMPRATRGPTADVHETLALIEQQADRKAELEHERKMAALPIDVRREREARASSMNF